MEELKNDISALKKNIKDVEKDAIAFFETGDKIAYRKARKNTLAGKKIFQKIRIELITQKKKVNENIATFNPNEITALTDGDFVK
jgi:hypothetical protein